MLGLVFPGQGSQKVGMLSDVIANHEKAKALFATANDLLDYDLLSIVLNGPEEKLNATEITQPAMLVADMIMWQKWCEENEERPRVLAGHSLGEYSALVAAEVISFKDAVKLVALRAKAMQAAVPAGKGAMAAILALTPEQVHEVCKQASEAEIVSAANFNSIGQIVIAGDTPAVMRACELAKQAGARKVVPLAVSVPSHCELMAPAAVELGNALSAITFHPPKIPVINNVNVICETAPEKIKQALIYQLTGPVRWVETIEKMVAMGCNKIIECGPGKVLTGMNKRIVKECECVAMD